MPALKLLPNEKIVFKTNPHWIFLWGPIVGLFFFWALLWLGSCPTFQIISLESLCHLFASLAILFSMAVIYLDWHFSLLYLTNFRLIKERGIIGKRLISIRLLKIQDLTVEIGIWGRILGFGGLVIESAGTFGQVRFDGFPHPLFIKRLVERENSRF